MALSAYSKKTGDVTRYWINSSLSRTSPGQCPGFFMLRVHGVSPFSAAARSNRLLVPATPQRAGPHIESSLFLCRIERAIIDAG